MTDETREISCVEAINEAFREEMRRDETVVMWGEDLISMGESGVTRGIFDEFGPDRILDTPIVETAIVDMAAGAAYAGLRPIAHLMLAGFVPLALDGLFLKLGSNYQEWAYQRPVPVVIYSLILGGGGYGSDHSISPEALLMHSPGLKVVMPSTPYDAKGLLKSAIRDNAPVVYMPHAATLGRRQMVPAEEYTIPLGQADVKRDGKDITIVTYSAMALKALAAAEKLAGDGIDAEVVDLRSLVPLDVETVVRSVRKTGRLLIVHEAMKRGGPAAEIAFRVTEAAPELAATMKHPVTRLACPNMAIPHSKELEEALVPQVDDIAEAVREMV
jgi:pyruvate dehydrogenase E1 component beta subunit